MKIILPNITPGNWDARPTGTIATADPKQNTTFIAEIRRHGPAATKTEEDQANAQAIAALPDLLTAFAGLYDQCVNGVKFKGDTLDKERTSIVNARAALLKAGATITD